MWFGRHFRWSVRKVSGVSGALLLLACGGEANEDGAVTGAGGEAGAPTAASGGAASGAAGLAGAAGGSSGGGSAGGTLADECERFCIRQAGTGCLNALPVPNCTDSCVGLAAMFPECAPQWTALTSCMADHELICDASGQPATTDPVCLELVDEFGACLEA